MNEMVERVAEAIGCPSAGMDCGFLEPRACANCRLRARAAIEAMREPTDGQRNAYYELSHQTEVMMDAHWERAIDAALKDGQGA